MVDFLDAFIFIYFPTFFFIKIFSKYIVLYNIASRSIYVVYIKRLVVSLYDSINIGVNSVHII